MIDISDGLLRDAGRVAAASGVRLDLRSGALRPRRRAARRRGPARQPTRLAWVLTGGEDHALLACFPRGVVLPADGVGRARSASGAHPSDGGRRDRTAGGTHFAAFVIGGRALAGRDRMAGTSGCAD